MPTPLKLLILEDNAFDAELEVGTLQAAGYDCDWRQVQTGEEFEASLDRPEFEVILADYNLPNFDGLSALGLLRERGLEIPFVLISGTLGEERAIESLKAGATDYVMKERLERLAPVVTRALNDRLERANRSAAQQALRYAHRRLQALSVRLLQVEETERLRIAQEALTNIARHAQASEVWVTLAGTEEELRLEVRDNGRGFDVAAARLRATAGTSMGLLSMEERATLAGGRLAIDSALSRETRLSPTLPLIRAGSVQV